MSFAYIVDGAVSEIIAMTPQDFANYYPESFRRDCQECGEDVQPNWTWDGERFAPRMEPLPTLAEARAAKINEINAGYETVIAYVQAGYPDKEVLTWERQAVQARELQIDPDAGALFVRALAATKGVTVDEMARRILANAESWEPVAAMLTAQRQLMEEAAWAAENLEALQAIKVSYTV